MYIVQGYSVIVVSYAQTTTEKRYIHPPILTYISIISHVGYLVLIDGFDKIFKYCTVYSHNYVHCIAG